MFFVSGKTTTAPFALSAALVLLAGSVAVSAADGARSALTTGTNAPSAETKPGVMDGTKDANLPALFRDLDNLHLRVNSGIDFGGSTYNPPAVENGPISKEMEEMHRQKQDWILQRPEMQTDDEHVRRMFRVNSNRTADEQDEGKLKSKQSVMQRYFDATSVQPKSKNSNRSNSAWDRNDDSEDQQSNPDSGKTSTDPWGTKSRDRQTTDRESLTARPSRDLDADAPKIDSLTAASEIRLQISHQQEMSQLIGLPFDPAQAQMQHGGFGQLNPGMVPLPGQSPEFNGAFNPAGSSATPLASPTIKLATPGGAGSLGVLPTLPTFGGAVGPSPLRASDSLAAPSRRVVQPVVLKVPTAPGVSVLQ